MRYLTSTVFLSVCLVSHAFAQLNELARLTEVQNELDKTQESLFELISEYGRLDRRLLEPLDQYSVSLIENERFSDADTVLDQAIQIIRVISIEVILKNFIVNLKIIYLLNMELNLVMKIGYILKVVQKKSFMILFILNLLLLFHVKN